MSNLAEVRPKLKQDSVFLQTKDGVFLRSDEAAFLLKGKSVYRWISALSPYMTGEHTLEALCEGLEPAQRDTVTRLVDTLLQRGVLKNHVPEAADLLPDAVRRHFRSQIEFIDHYVDRPVERFKNFRESRILLIGSGESFATLALSLMRNGVREIFLASTDESPDYLGELEAEATALRQDGVEALISLIPFDVQNASSSLSNYDFIVYCADDSTSRRTLDLQQRCIAEGRAFLAAVIFDNQAILGPLVKPRGGPCWLCAQMRLAANAEGKRSAALWRALAPGEELTGVDTGLSTPLARRIGNGLGFELFKAIAGHLPADTAGGVILQDLETLESYHCKLNAHPLCPLCSHADVDSCEQQTLEIVSGKRDREMTLKEELLRRSEPLVDRRSGAFNSFIDDKLTQVPLKVSRLKVASPASPLTGDFEVTAFSSETLLEARVFAFLEAAGRYTRRLPDRRKMVIASLNELLESGKTAIAAERFVTWSGASAPGSDSRCAWLPAYSLFTRHLCYVPAAAVYPYSRFNRGHVFERTAAGSATHANFSDLLTAGLISALGYEHMRAVMQGRSAVGRLDGEALEGIDTTLAFLLRNAKHFERPFALLEVLPDSPLHIVLACTTDTVPDQVTAIGCGLSGIEAAKRALLDFVGNLQLLKYEGGLPDRSENLFPEFSPRSDLVYTASASRFHEPAATLQQLEDYVRASGRDLLFVNTTTADIWEQGTLISGTVLLARAASQSGSAGNGL